MKNNILKDFTNVDLLKELLNRNEEPITPIITPYMIMKAMILKEWKENPKIGKSNNEIDKIWDYVGYPNYTDDISWCAATVNCCLKLAGYKMSNSIPVARSFEDYGIEAAKPKQGDIAVFKKIKSSWQGHVGFIAVFPPESNIVTIAGGNQNNRVCYMNYDSNGSYLNLTRCRTILHSDKIGEPDIKTLKDWGLFETLIESKSSNK